MAEIIDEYVGRVTLGDSAVWIAHMRAPAGWDEPFQPPDFDEFTVVLEGALVMDTPGGEVRVSAGQAVITRAGDGFTTARPRGRRTSRSASRLSRRRRPTGTTSGVLRTLADVCC